MAEYKRQKDTGRIFEVMGEGRLRELSPEEIAVKSGDRNVLQDWGDSLSLGLVQGARGAQQLMTGQEQPDIEQAAKMKGAISDRSPVASFLGDVAGLGTASALVPALAAGAGAGVGLTTGLTGLAEAGIGAAMMPESPGMGAALGAGGVGVGAALPSVWRGAQAAAGGIRNMELPVPGITGMVPRSASERAGMVPRNMSERVVQTMDPEFVGPPSPAAPRFNKGLMTTEELDELGVPLTTSQRMSLNAVGEAENNVAKQMAAVEKIRGQGHNERIAQRSAFTRLFRNEVNLADEVALTDTVVGEGLKREGAGIGEVMKQRGTGLAIPQTDLDDIKFIADNSDTTFAPAMKNIHKDIVANMRRNGGELSEAGFNDIRKRLRDMSLPGMAQEKITAANKIMDHLVDQLERQLSANQREVLRGHRYRYKLWSIAARGKNIGDDHLLNPTSFGNAWDKSIRVKMRGLDRIGKAADTFSHLAYNELHAGNTLTRWQEGFANAPATIGRGARGAALGFAGIGGVDALTQGAASGAAQWLLDR